MKNSASIAFLLLASALPLQAATAQETESRSEEITTGFVYEIPPEAEAVPGLAAQLEAEQETARFAFQDIVAEMRQYEDERPGLVDNLTYHQNWSMAGRQERLMSLASQTYRYDGGAHGNTEFDAKLWDLEAGRQIPFTALFEDRYAALSVIDPQYCMRLNALRGERGLDVENTDVWDRCPALHEQTVFPSAANNVGPFTHIEILVAPYVAGPYAVGTFEVTVPVNEDLIALLRPEYSGSFAVPSN